MEIEQSFSVPFPRETVWESFQDVEGIVGCLPGASLTEPPQGEQLAVAMSVKLGPIVAAFKGQGKMELDHMDKRGVVSGQGSDRKSGSRVKGEARFVLVSEGDSATRVDVTVDYSITGSLAQFSRGGIVRELATRLTEAFGDNLKARLEAQYAVVDSAQTPVPTLSNPLQSAEGAPVTPQTGEPAAAKPAPAKAVEQAPLDLGNLFWVVLFNRIRRLFGLKEKHQ
ncbi:SRPBCC family protein [Stutzerimonas stutzeri]|uniref:Carbon monoxide dehydrogenase n=1 Tax=Stutzerimonas stutzeri TaxID=316 RepID=A0A6I6LVM1_STUST|nr:SRPBCC family protein [Stutzerimonas stutzeri]QGZ30411.1 carbon monoxide dehydrogenase [Stutzerimonas stutzeri]